jgi:SAM-dependent methyltransferase
MECGGIRRVKRSYEDLWNAEYDAGRYEDEKPVAFVGDIVTAARKHRLRKGVYIGCGNGRNYLPLVSSGLDLVGIDVSGVAIEKLRERAPDRQDRLLHGDISVLPAGATFSVVVGIQVFQHGDRDAAHSLIRAAQRLVALGGLFCLRVNATDTDVIPAHEITERSADGAFTVRYLDGPKRDLDIHFFSEQELGALFSDSFEPVLALRRKVTWRVPRSDGQWSQWEAIWRRIPAGSSG